MGQIADDVLSGLICQYCLCWLDDEEPGYPRTCNDCAEGDDIES